MGRDSSRVGALIALVALGSALGCGSVSIKRVGRSTAGPVAVPLRSSLGGEAPPPPTPSGEIPPTVEPSPDRDADPADPQALLIEAETDRQRGIASARASAEIAARFELTAVGRAVAALEVAQAGPPGRVDGEEVRTARAEYAAAVADFLRDSSRDRIRLDPKWEREMAAQGFRVRFDPEASTWSPDRFDEFLVTTDYRIAGLQHEYHYDGIGVPLIGVRRFRPGELTHREGEAKFLMPREVYPVTAVLRPRRLEPRPGAGAAAGAGDGVELAALHKPEPTVAAAIPPVPPDEYALELHDPILERRVDFQGRSEPLAADLTTSLTYRFANNALPILQEIGLLDPESLEKLAGLYMVHPYIPGRIPVVFVHGLRSSPAAWLQVMNEIRGDPELRDRYQVWLFMYPTGTPFPYSAAKLRAQLGELRDVIDPAHADPTLDDAVLVGHSMGGLITRLMISASGDDLWRLISDRNFEELRASPERKAMLRDVFFFEPHPMIARAVFIATPHRGSELGDEFIGRLADRLIRLPSSLRQTYRALLIQNGRDFFTPEVRAGLPSSIDELRRDNRLLMAMSRLPTKPGLEAHSIIGRKDPADPVPQSTDGVVPYASSHIDWAVSEKVVAGDHGCQREPATIEELRSILTRHLRRAYAAPIDADLHQAGASKVDGAIRRARADWADDDGDDEPDRPAPDRSRPIARSVGEPDSPGTARSVGGPSGWRPVRR